jgi:DNA-directed RNA polymerase specialized sigma subunit
MVLLFKPRFDMNNLKYLSQQNYQLNKEIERGIIHIPSNRRKNNNTDYEKVDFSYVGLEAVEQFESQSSEFRGFELEDIRTELALVMGSVLTPKEQHTIEMSFGLLSYDEMNDEEIGNELGVMRERARQIRVRAITKLQNYFTKL